MLNVGAKPPRGLIRVTPIPEDKIDEGSMRREGGPSCQTGTIGAQQRWCLLTPTIRQTPVLESYGQPDTPFTPGGILGH